MDENKQQETEKIEETKPEVVEEKKEEIIEPIEDKKEEKPFLNEALSTKNLKPFLAGIVTALVVGLVFCSISNCGSPRKELHLDSNIRAEKSLHGVLGSSVGEDVREMQHILNQLEQIHSDIRAINKMMDDLDNMKEYREGSSYGESSGVTIGKSIGESFAVSNGSSQGISQRASRTYSSITNNDFKVEKKGNNVKLYIFNPDKVILHFEKEGRKIADHYYIEKIENGKTTIRLDETVKVYSW